jgi:hypothetical protein
VVAEVAALPQQQRLVLDEHHRVVAAQGGRHQALVVVRVAGGDHLHSRQVGEEPPETLRVLRGRADAAPGRLEHHRHPLPPARHVGDLGRGVVDLLEADADEIDEHDLDQRAHPRLGEADAHAGESHLGDRRVDDAALAEALLQPLGRAEHAPGAADVLAQAQDRLVALHLQRDGLGDGRGQRHRQPVVRALRHRAHARASSTKR